MMGKKELLELNNTIKENFPDVNCYSHCTLLQSIIPNDCEIYYNGNHTILFTNYRAENGEFHYLYIDNQGEYKIQEESNFSPLEEYGKDSVFQLAKVDFNLGV